MFKKFIVLIGLLCFAFSSAIEAKQHKAVRRASVVKKNVVKPGLRQKRQAVASRRRPQPVSRARNQSRATVAKKRPVRAARTRSPRVTATRTRYSRVAKIRHSRTVVARKRAQPPVQQPLPIQPPPPSYLSLLNSHNQQKAKRVGLDVLYSKNLLGQAQTIALTEGFNWKEMQNIIQNNQSALPLQLRENYKKNFLSPIGFHSEEMKDGASIKDDTHGPEVSSVLLDLAPQAKVLPVSTHQSPQPDQSYDLADALLELSHRKDVSIVNDSGGYSTVEINTRKNGYNVDGTSKYEVKYSFPPRLLEAFRAITKVGKVIVIAAGNKGESIEVPVSEFLPYDKSRFQHYVSFLLENLDLETRQSIVFAGALDSDTRLVSSYSNKPGNWLEAQERFLFAPGDYHLSYKNYLVGGTSFAAPTICAVLANLCSKPGVTPQRALKALLESADKDPDVRTYGRGRLNAAKALDLLERGFE